MSCITGNPGELTAMGVPGFICDTSPYGPIQGGGHLVSPDRDEDQAGSL